jgi:hypothetical protein
MELQAWRAVGASVVGTSHVKTGAPCQDSHRLEIVDGAEPIVVMVASDGAGSASRSEYGSAIACQELTDNIRLFLEDGGHLADITRELATGWLENAAVALSEEAAATGVSVREYACTLLVAIVSENHAVFMQVGDGAIVFWGRGEDDWCLMAWPQHGEYINTTCFLTDSVARANFEFCSTKQPVDEIAVFTDGIEALVLHYATQSVHSPFFDGVFPAVRALVEPGFSAEMSSKLAAYLGSNAISDRTDDDKTLLLASRVKRPASRALVPLPA